MEADRAYKNLIWKDSDWMSGQACFYGTRNPVAYLFYYFEHDDSIERFSKGDRI